MLDMLQFVRFTLCYISDSVKMIEMLQLEEVTYVSRLQYCNFSLHIS